MRIAIISDIHANLEALNSVLDDIRERGGAERVWCLGDIVGYGPEPRECIEALRNITNICIAGNHDLASIGKLSTEDFNPDAAAACRWTAKQLSPSDAEYLGNLPLVVREGDFTLVHGSPREPVLEYLTSIGQAIENLPLLKTRYCLIGHSHIPLAFKAEANGKVSGGNFSGELKLNPKQKLFINPGGVGQPRDRDPRASYAIYDSEKNNVKLYRVPYDIEATQTKMTELGLPKKLASRLAYGM
jgi:predicted phosphodiesterase